MTNASTAIAKAKARPMFYTRENASVKVGLWLSNSTHDRAPILTGTIDRQHVSAFLRQGPRRPFLDIVGAKDENGINKPIATANIVAGGNGYPKLIMKMARGGKDVWVDATNDAPHEVLERIGLDIARMLEKQELARAARESRNQTEQENA